MDDRGVGTPNTNSAAASTGQPAADTVRLVLDGWAHGGQAVGRLEDGRACFVPRAIPGETVDVTVHTMKKRYATAELQAVVEPSPHRVKAPCPLYDRCGGCQLQHVAPPHQLALKHRVVVEQLQRIAGLANPPVAPVMTPTDGWPANYRSWARMAVADSGHLGFRQARSHTVQPVDRCLLLSDPAQQLRSTLGDDWAGAKEVALMAGSDGSVVSVTTADPPGEVDGSPAAVEGLGIVIDGRIQRDPATVSITVAGRSLRASAGTFFQAGTAGAEALVEVVMNAVDLQPDDTVADLYAGGGLLSVFLAADAGHLVAVEADAAAAADAEHNLGRHAGATTTEVVAQTVEQWLRSGDHAVDVVVLDPPRRGAKPEVINGLIGLAPRQIVYVACDPAALARDTRTLVAGGYTLTAVQPLDLFGHTAHIEAVATFAATSGPSATA